jgi:hypothetical protein
VAEQQGLTLIQSGWKVDNLTKIHTEAEIDTPDVSWAENVPVIIIGRC